MIKFFLFFLILLAFYSINPDYIYAEIKVNILGGNLSFSIISSTFSSVNVLKGESIIFGTMTVKNDGTEMFDISLSLTNNSPFNLVDTQPGKDEIRFFGIFSNTFPSINDFTDNDIITTSRKVSFIDIFAKDSDEKYGKGYDVVQGQTRNIFFRIDAPKETEYINKPYSFILNVTVLPSDYAGKKIDINGGVVEISNRIKLDIPPGGLKEPKEIYIQKKDIKTFTGEPVCVYEILPKGTIFRRPVTLTLSYKEAQNIQNEDNLRIYYWDGYEWRYTGGTVDKINKTVTTKINHLSIYGILSMKTLHHTHPQEKIITPAFKDGKNDVAYFDSLAGKDVEINIFDITGRKVKSIKVLDKGNIWDGTDEEGNIVESGIYIYQFRVEDKVHSGTIVVAK